LTREWSRLFVETDDARAVDLLRRTFGVTSLSVVEHECAGDLRTIVDVGTRGYADFVAGRSFAVRARRVGGPDYTSMDLMQKLGAALAPRARCVDLKRPEVEVFVEVRGDAAYLYSHQHKGPAGLPLGVSGKVLCLLSGGFDSAVAAWMMQKRGVDM